MVHRAGEQQGRSVSDFVVAAAAARESAERVIEDATLLRLSAERGQRFVDLLLDPPSPSPAMERARQAHARLIAG